jgi:threonine/homoserine/homoserine lactone efflux protein
VLSVVLAFAVLAGLVTMVPGLDTALVLRAAVSSGRSAAFATVAGVSIGLLVWGAAAALGVSALMLSSAWAFEVLRLAGAGYMVILGIVMIGRSLGRAQGQPLADPGGGVKVPLWEAFRRGLLTNLLNPKIGAFYVAVLPQFLPADVPPLVGGLLLASIHVLEGLAWFTLLILAAGFLAPWLQRPAVRAWVDRITGGVLIGFGARLAIAPV